MGVEHFGDADIFLPDEGRESAECFAKAVWVAQGTFEKLELLSFRDGGLDAE